MIDTLRRYGSDLLAVVLPQTCEVCGDRLVEGEDIVCLHCLHDMPRCRFDSLDFNEIHQRAMRNAHIYRATAMFYYSRLSPYSALIQSAKYRNRPRIIDRLARLFASELLASTAFFDGIDCIIPVPIHLTKHIMRGYNQSDHLARGLSSVTGIPAAKNLKTTHRTSTQTRKNAAQRWENKQNAYGVDQPDRLNGKHILIVDDVITTGATINACCEAIHKAAPTATISVLSIAMTRI